MADFDCDIETTMQLLVFKVSRRTSTYKALNTRRASRFSSSATF
jgi:hypothetical protein